VLVGQIILAKGCCTWAMTGFRWREGCIGCVENMAKDIVHGLRLALDGRKIVEDGQKI